jgi:hypothetical protein
MVRLQWLPFLCHVDLLPNRDPYLSLKDLIMFLISDNYCRFQSSRDGNIPTPSFGETIVVFAWQRPMSEIGTYLGKCATIIAPQGGVL